MPVDAEKEITRLYKALHSAQDEIGKTYYRWRKVALEFAGDNVKPLDVALRAAEVFGKDIGKSFLPRMNWLKGEEGFMMILGKALAGLWITDGGLATAEKGENPGEIFIKCTRDPWPTWAKEFGVSMEEVALCRERMYQSVLEDVSMFMNIPLKIELEKAISRGQGETVMRLYKTE
ncbi:MAG: hypothetical protein JSV83_04865 [Desulfobacterales bacterium]|nr:MAG: hypothetical protein JSV83_04865 [Desulfobacterales bacterium]